MRATKPLAVVIAAALFSVAWIDQKTYTGTGSTNAVATQSGIVISPGVLLRTLVTVPAGMTNLYVTFSETDGTGDLESSTNIIGSNSVAVSTVWTGRVAHGRVIVTTKNMVKTTNTVSSSFTVTTLEER